MDTIDYQFDVGDKVFVHKNTNCSFGTVTAVIITVEKGSIEESYHVNCEHETITADVNRVGNTREEVIEKIIRVQAESLSAFRRFVNRYLKTTYYKRAGRLTLLSRLHNSGYVLNSSDEIKHVHFTKVEYIKDSNGIVVRFHTNYNYYDEAYATLDEATMQLKMRLEEMKRNLETKIKIKH